MLLAVGVVAAVLLLIGLALSPRVDGHPILLSPANWKLTRYLSKAERWLRVLEEEQTRLAAMIPRPEMLSREELPVLPTPVGVTSLYERSRILERSLARLGRVRQEMEEAEAPTPLRPLHALAVATADQGLKLHAAVATALGSPSQGARAKAEAQAQTAADHLLALRRALEAQLALLGRMMVTATATAAPTPKPHVYLPLVIVEG